MIHYTEVHGSFIWNLQQNLTSLVLPRGPRLAVDNGRAAFLFAHHHVHQECWNVCFLQWKIIVISVMIFSLIFNILPGSRWKLGRGLLMAASYRDTWEIRLPTGQPEAAAAPGNSGVLSSGSTWRNLPTLFFASTPEIKKIKQWDKFKITKISITCFWMSLCRMFMMKPISRGYRAIDWMTVLMNRVGKGLCSIKLCMTTANTSCVYDCCSAKHNEVAEIQFVIGRYLKKQLRHNLSLWSSYLPLWRPHCAGQSAIRQESAETSSRSSPFACPRDGWKPNVKKLWFCFFPE